MILGLDVGGTQTDTVLIDNNEILAVNKIPTEPNLVQTLKTAINQVISNLDSFQIERLVFSTTMATNAIIQNQLVDTGMIISAGPGIDPHLFSVGPAYSLVEGSLDHQGIETWPLNKEAILFAARQIKNKGIKTIGIVSKFSVHNSIHEIQIKEWVTKEFQHVSLGHSVSGFLNFPRRIATTYLNAALSEMHNTFTTALTKILDEKGCHAPKFILKPDGGTVELSKSNLFPARTAQSGPAASVMGVLALDKCKGTTLALDIGGTTTDMAVIVDGVPLRAPFGIRLGNFHTLIRSLMTRSIGLGGDSEIRVNKKGMFKIGPLRKGRPVALGGNVPTPTDAMITLDLFNLGSKTAAIKAMSMLGAGIDLDAKSTAEHVLLEMGNAIAQSVKSFVHYINSRPVYTIKEVLYEQKIEPGRLVIIGGPASQLAKYIGEALNLPYTVPAHAGVANAIGAALAMVTTEITLQADTQRGTVIIPEACFSKAIDSAFDMDDAVRLASSTIREQALKFGADPKGLEFSVVEKQIFNMIRNYSRVGQNIRLKLCINPGLLPGWKRNF